MVEKAVRAALSKFNFFEPDHSKVVCFTNMARIILSQQWYKYKKESFNDAKVRTITATTNFIKN